MLGVTPVDRELGRRALVREPRAGHLRKVSSAPSG